MDDARHAVAVCNRLQSFDRIVQDMSRLSNFDPLMMSCLYGSVNIAALVGVSKWADVRRFGPMMVGPSLE